MERPQLAQPLDGSSPRATRPHAPPSILSSSGVYNAGSKNPLRHVSPRKFHQIQQQQRAAVLRAVPLSPLAPPRIERSCATQPTRLERSIMFESYGPVSHNPSWQPNAPTAQESPAAAAVASAQAVEALLRGAGAMGTTPSTTVGTVALDEWLQSYEHELHTYESLETFVHVKLPEALAFCDKIEQQSLAYASDASVTTTGFRADAHANKQPTSRFHVRLRIAVFAHLVEHTVHALAHSTSLAHVKRTLFQTRQEIFRAMFADYDTTTATAVDEESSDCSSGDDARRHCDPPLAHRRYRQQRHRRSRQRTTTSGRTIASDSDDSDLDNESDATTTCRSRKTHYASSQGGHVAVPRPLAFFLAKVPFALKLSDDTQRRAVAMKRHHVVLRRIVQSLYQSLGSVFHAWKLLVRHKRDERLNTKGAQLTAMVVQQRGLVRAVFVAWSKAALRSRLTTLQCSARDQVQQHELVVADLQREVFQLREKIRALEQVVASHASESPQVIL